MTFSEDGIALRDLVKVQVYDLSSLFGPSPLLLIQPPSLEDEAPVMGVNTPPDKELSQCSTAELLLGESTVGRMVAPGSIVVPVAKSNRNAFASSIIVGRALNCDITLRDSSVSKVHAYLIPPKGWPALNGLWKIQDRQSTNGTDIVLASGSVRLPHGETRRLPYDSELRFGSVGAIFLEGKRLDSLVQHARKAWRKAGVGPDFDDADKPGGDTEKISSREEVAEDEVDENDVETERFRANLD